MESLVVQQKKVEEIKPDVLNTAPARPKIVPLSREAL